MTRPPHMIFTDEIKNNLKMGCAIELFAIPLAGALAIISALWWDLRAAVTWALLVGVVYLFARGLNVTLAISDALKEGTDARERFDQQERWRIDEEQREKARAEREESRKRAKEQAAP